MKVKYETQKATNFMSWLYFSRVSIASYKLSKF